MIGIILYTDEVQKAMLINFTVKNFKSFKEELMLNLSAAKRFSIDNTIPAETYQINILPVTGIYGANGSGKSNLVNAIDFMRRKVLNEYPPFPAPFKLDCQSNESEPSSFAVLFIDKKNIMYHYGFSVCGSEIIEEWLSAYYKGKRESILFERSRENLEEKTFEYNFGQKFIKATEKGKRAYLDFTTAGLKSTRLLITELAERQGNTAANDVFSWFRSNLMVIKPGAVYSAIPFAFMVDKEFTDEVTKLLRNMDFDFDGFKISSRNVDLDYVLSRTATNAEEREKMKAKIEGTGESFWDSFLNRYAMFHKTADGKLTEKTLLLKHIRKDGSTAYLTIDEASSGFRRMLDLVILLMNNDTMKNTTVIIDEIEQSLHTVISRNLIEELKENSMKNDGKSQLVFITHDTNLLDLNLLRRDEIQFMEKDRVTGESHITNFAEFKVVPGLNVEKGYLEGRFGAIPLLHHNLNWRKHGKKN